MIENRKRGSEKGGRRRKGRAARKGSEAGRPGGTAASRKKDERDSRVPAGVTFREKNHQKGHLLMFIFYITLNI